MIIQGDVDPKAIQQINFSGNLDLEATMFFITEDVNETILVISQETVRLFQYHYK